jgi:shikimate dehydrogenase
VVSGLEMLVHQAAEQVRLMTGLAAPVEQMRAAGLAAMGSR